MHEIQTFQGNQATEFDTIKAFQFEKNIYLISLFFHIDWSKYLLHNNLLETTLSRSTRYQDQPG